MNAITYNQSHPLIRAMTKRRLDEFLDIYSFYLQTRVDILREALLAKAAELQELDPNFTFLI